MKELAVFFKEKDVIKLASFLETNSVIGNTPISELVPSVFKDIKEYQEFLHEFCVKNAINRIKHELSVDDLISTYSDFADIMDELINSWFERVAEMFTIYYPEASLKASELESFTKLSSLDRSSVAKLFNINAESMGLDFEKKDVVMLDDSIKTLKSLVDKKDSFAKRIEELIMARAPNTGHVATPLIAAKLMAMAGGLHKLALMPSSTIQVIGAERALFRHLRGKAKPPKHGIIAQVPLISAAPLKHKGKLARALASKISIAAKVDYFKGASIWERLVKSLDAKRKGLK